VAMGGIWVTHDIGVPKFLVTILVESYLHRMKRLLGLLGLLGFLGLLEFIELLGFVEFVS
jgi:hypothetical protein